MLSKMFTASLGGATNARQALLAASKSTTVRALFTCNSNSTFNLRTPLTSRSTAVFQQMRMFSSEKQPIEIEINEEGHVDHEPLITQTEKKEFKAETRKLLDIVAKSIYTDKEVFVRELISNSSDALEKQRYAEISGEVSGAGDPQGLYINIITNEKERLLTIFDSGIGMSRDEVTENLGTIARSGSSEFIKKLQ